MKILLTLPKNVDQIKSGGIVRSKRKYPPIEFLYLGTILSENHTVKVIDGNAENIKLDKIKKNIERYGPEWVVISSEAWDFWGCPFPYGGQLSWEIGAFAKENNAKTIFIGPYASLTPQDYLHKFDFIVQNDPEIAVQKIIEGKTKERIVRFPVDLNMLPIPDFDLLPLKAYKQNEYPGLSLNNFFVLSGSRGCPFPCIFCLNPILQGKKYRLRDPSKVIEEIEILMEKGIRSFFFQDSIFTLNKKWAQTICSEIINKGLEINWGIQTRTDFTRKDLIKSMAKAGCKFYSLGVEHIDPSIQRVIKKIQPIGQVLKTIKMVLNEGIGCGVNLMMNFPGETLRTLMKNAKFRAWCDKFGIGGGIKPVIPFPGTELHKMQKFPNSIDAVTIEAGRYNKRPFYLFYNMYKRYFDMMSALHLKDSYEIVFDHRSNLSTPKSL
ncbi:MAG: B12-binding domain-containing radical SAM protein [Candidatus Helarchaeota archaeon]|nr:B12-binding domain-containing radical SAM protein [Candidatus Helarchaeota archaeon]